MYALNKYTNDKYLYLVLGLGQLVLFVPRYYYCISATSKTCTKKRIIMQNTVIKTSAKMDE